MAKGLMRVAAWSFWGAARPLAQSTVHQDLQSRTVVPVASPSSLHCQQEKEKVLPLPGCRRVEAKVFFQTAAGASQRSSHVLKKGMTTGWFPDDLLALMFRGELEALCRRENSFHTAGWREWSGTYPCPEHIPLTGRGVCPRQCCSLWGCLSSWHALEENLGIWFGGVSMI